ncbi:MULTISPECIES: VC0807 family protein [Pseudoalteromonas]|uniref:Intracellular septation protein A n=2 Tax=Pseudoalteromonas TaxID=53246 RepID=V4HS48_PSEL2|nr:MULTISPECIES: VC0807 family protein [Pseudoalteromonas]ESP92613.1 Intracellular septation protein A [Pseudoalteromonas luteoviolacea 2ta16]KZN35419.1 MFS transporter [Pseudoalteromonas luteoviolacea NCIMB 1944]MCG7546606.1 MFS transporter [Pseudoalteromonas sp. Of7M-16]MDK2595764.1 VC0807 family protein [Pseudoalteromonas sp. P94(2023)]
MAEPDNKPSGFFSQMLFNIILPVIILTRFSGEEHLGPSLGVVVALAFPVGFGLWERQKTGKFNFISALGIVSVLLTGGISLLELDAKYIAIKEALIPGVIGVAIVVSQYTKYPLLKTMLFNENVMDIPKIDSALKEKGNLDKLPKVQIVASNILAGSFFLSSVLNYVLAKMIVVSPAGTEAYNNELGRMTALSYPVIVLPTMVIFFVALYYLINSLKKLTGLKMEEMFIEQ